MIQNYNILQRKLGKLFGTKINLGAMGEYKEKVARDLVKYGCNMHLKHLITLLYAC